MIYAPAGNSSGPDARNRRAVGGRCAPVTARGRDVLTESLRRLQQVEPDAAYGKWRRLRP
jgi:hypothetical protein